MGANLSPFFSNLVRNEFSWKRGLCQSFKYFNYLPLCQKSEKTNESFLRKMLMDGQTDNSDFTGPSAT